MGSYRNYDFYFWVKIPKTLVKTHGFVNQVAHLKTRFSRKHSKTKSQNLDFTKIVILKISMKYPNTRKNAGLRT